MKFIFELAHPKHYYQFRATMHRLESEGHKILVVARDKDVLLKILEEENRAYAIYGQHGKRMLRKFTALPELFITYYKIVKKFGPDVIVSKASPYAAIISKFYQVKTAITPDSEVVTLTNKFVAPHSDVVITPKTFKVDFGQKHRFINGFFEDCYLHPSIFTPNAAVLDTLQLKPGQPYFILRFIGWTANHDVNNFGFSAEEKEKLVARLEPHGQVFISSEAALPENLEKYRIKIPASQMHSALHFAKIYVGDSQTMATESALLGTPSVRYNSFVGPNDMSNFIILENQYGILKNCASFADVENHIDGLLANPGSKQTWLKKRQSYYEQVGDVNEQIVNELVCQSLSTNYAN